MTDNKREKRRIIKIQLLIGFIVILVAIIAIEFFLKQTEVKKLKYSHSIKMEQVHVQLDSIQHELELRYEEVAQLGGDTAELRMIINQIEEDKANLEIRVKNATARYTRMEGKVNAYRILLLKKDEELAKLRTDNEKLFKINIGLKTTIIKQSDSIRVIQKDKDKLEDKVAIASELKIENIQYSYITKKGKEVVVKDGKPFKSSAVDKIKISFHLPANKVSRKGGKDIMLRVIEPEGSVVLAGSPGSSRFECEGKELLFTSKKTILYDNKEKNVAFLYHQNSYKIGKHITELYADGRQIGKGAFYIK